MSTAFIELALQYEVLRFGEFTLKSGRVSPYFFNMGKFDGGAALAQLGRFYAQAIVDAGLDFDMLFGPAYKGIPLAAATVIALADTHGRDVPYCFNRKEAKTHGEAGMLVGAPLRGKVLIVDDVMTAGTAIRESLAIIEAAGATAAGVVIALDRQERGQGALSAVQEVAQTMPVVSIASLADILRHVQNDPALNTYAAAIEAYRRAYGVAL